MPRRSCSRRTARLAADARPTAPPADRSCRSGSLIGLGTGSTSQARRSSRGASNDLLVNQGSIRMPFSRLIALIVGEQLVETAAGDFGAGRQIALRLKGDQQTVARGPPAARCAPDMRSIASCAGAPARPRSRLPAPDRAGESSRCARPGCWKMSARRVKPSGPLSVTDAIASVRGSSIKTTSGGCILSMTRRSRHQQKQQANDTQNTHSTRRRPLRFTDSPSASGGRSGVGVRVGVGDGVIVTVAVGAGVGNSTSNRSADRAARSQR